MLQTEPTHLVIPAKAGISVSGLNRDSRFRGNDDLLVPLEEI